MVKINLTSAEHRLIKAVRGVKDGDIYLAAFGKWIEDERKRFESER